MANAEERFCSELPPLDKAKPFNMRLDDGREADADVPLVSLGEPLVIVCRLNKPTAQSLYRSRGGLAREDIVESLGNFDTTGELDLSSSATCEEKLVEAMLNAAIDTKRTIVNLCLDGCDITDGVLSSLTVMLPKVERFSCRYAGLVDEQLSTLASMVSSVSVCSLDLSHNELTSGYALIGFLTKCSKIYGLHISDLDLDIGEDALMNVISGMQSLRELDISFSKWLKAKHMEKILSGCEHLVKLTLDGCDLRDLSFESTWLPNLRELTMVGCQLTEFDSLVEWMSMGCVQKLDLSGTEITLGHVGTLVEARIMCPPITVRLSRARAVERDPQAFVDMMLTFVSERTFPIRFQFSPHFTTAVETITAFLSNFLSS